MSRVMARATRREHRPVETLTVAAATLSVLIAAGSVGLVAAVSRAGISPPSAVPSALTKSQVRQHYGNLPLSFEANVGQAASNVRFLAQGGGTTTLLERDRAVIVPGGGGTPVEMRLVGSAPQPAISGGNELPGIVNYMIGNDRSQWHTGVATYGEVTYHQVYAGIDMAWHGTQGAPEYDFDVAAGVDPSVIALTFAGATSLSIDLASGDLVMTTSTGSMRQHAPHLYQDTAAGRQPISGHFLLQGRNQVGFAIGAYDTTRPLIIDPTFTQSTYLGGAGRDIGKAVAVDGAGNTYVAGSTCSTNFPTTAGSFQTAFGGATCDVGGNAFVSKLNAQGTALVYSTYVGGSGFGEEANGLVIDASGDAFISGDTLANDYPTTPGAFEAPPFAAVDQRAFVTELNPSGSGLLYSTYLGGVSLGSTNARAIAIHGGDIYVAGNATDRAFPTTAGSLQPSYSVGPGEYFDGFMAKLDPTLAGDGSGVISATNQQLVYSTYLGGNGDEKSPSFGIAVDSTGIVYVDGFTSSTNFPVTANAFQTTNQATPNPPDFGYNVFVSKLNPAGGGIADLLYSTYIGGSPGYSLGRIGLALGPPAVTGAPLPTIYIAGQTRDTNFPATAGAFQATEPGSDDGFFSKLNPAGQGGGDLMYSTYLGSAGNEFLSAVAVTPAGDAVVTGASISSSFHTVNAIQPVCGCFTSQGTAYDAVVAEIDPSAFGVASLVFSTFLGGTGSDVGLGIASDAAGNIYVTGNTGSPQPTGSRSFPPIPFPTTPGAFQRKSGDPKKTINLGDAFLTKIAFADLSVHLAASPNPAGLGKPLTYLVTVKDNGPSPASPVVTDVLPVGLTYLTASGGCVPVTANGVTTVTCTLAPLAVGRSALVTITVRPRAQATFTNTVMVDGNAADVVPSNNSASVRVQVS